MKEFEDKITKLNETETFQEEGKIEIAKSMLNKNMEINLILELTGLTEEEINNLKD